jgi:mitogen-activated protein kinase kinase 1
VRLNNKFCIFFTLTKLFLVSKTGDSLNMALPLGGAQGSVPTAAGNNNTAGGSISLSIGSEVPSFRIFNSCFVKDDIAIHSKGVEMRDRKKSFTVAPDELKLGNVIGRGFSSYVQHAIHIPTGTPLALKVINAFEKVKRDQLVKEIKTLYDASSTNIVTFYGAFYRDGAISIALEYMDGGSLANVIAQVGRVPEPVLANMTFQMLAALAYMKKHTRVHRDIKPENMLINSQGFVKLTDFGVSSVVQGSNAMCGTFVGTFLYMSPERIQNKPYSYTSDIWSFGLVLIYLAIGRYPYPKSDSYIEMVQTILESPVPTLPKGFSKEFSQFLQPCVDKNPRSRLPPDILAGSPWISMHGASAGIPSAVANVKRWIDQVRNSSTASITGK